MTDPEFVTELVGLVQAEKGVPEELRTLALRCVAVQLMDRSRHAAVIAAITAGGQSGLLSMLLHKSVAAIVAQGTAAARGAAAAAGGAAGGAGAAPGDAGAAPGDGAPATGTSTAETGAASAAATGAAAGASSAGTSSAAGTAIGVPAAEAAHAPVSVAFVEALLSLVGSLVTSTSGCSALADAGIIAALLPLLHDTDPGHVQLVAVAVKILEAYMDFSQTACTMFRDLGGLRQMIDRLAFEVGVAPIQKQQQGDTEMEAAGTVELAGAAAGTGSAPGFAQQQGGGDAAGSSAANAAGTAGKQVRARQLCFVLYNCIVMCCICCA